MNAHDTPQIFDTFGRRLPVGLISPAHQESRRWFQFSQPEIDYSTIHARIIGHLGNNQAPTVSANEFERRAKAILSRLLDDPMFANLVRGTGVPFLLPAACIDDYGTALEERYLPAVAASFKAKQPNYDFHSHAPASLSTKLTIAPNSRHAQLLDAVQNSDLIGWFYPCLLEYSVPAMREAIAELPENVLLAGGIDTCAALVGNPDLLFRTDGYPPLLWLAALNGEKEGIGYHFEAYGYNLTFNRRAHLGKAAEYWAGALVILD